jgi:hypothetical protein
MSSVFVRRHLVVNWSSPNSGEVFQRELFTLFVFVLDFGWTALYSVSFWCVMDIHSPDLRRSFPYWTLMSNFSKMFLILCPIYVFELYVCTCIFIFSLFQLIFGIHMLVVNSAIYT